jgi:hypothetical protein
VEGGAATLIVTPAGESILIDTGNRNSVVLLVSLRAVSFFRCRDLSWNVEKELMCPANRVGKVDVYQVPISRTSTSVSQGRSVMRPRASHFPFTNRIIRSRNSEKTTALRFLRQARSHSCSTDQADDGWGPILAAH